MDGHRCFFYALHAAAVFLYGVARALHLALACLATQLGNQFVKLADTGSAQGMALGFQSSGRVDRDASTHRELAALRSETTAAEDL